jgi:hypothetical protein
VNVSLKQEKQLGEYDMNFRTAGIGELLSSSSLEQNEGHGINFGGVLTANVFGKGPIGDAVGGIRGLTNGHGVLKLNPPSHVGGSPKIGPKPGKQDVSLDVQEQDVLNFLNSDHEHNLER